MQRFEGKIAPLPSLYEGKRAVAWMTRSITRQHELQQRLKRLGETDQLTGLYNRHFFFDQYHHRVQGQHLTGLIMLDLDHFKQINDRFGHQTGDKVLCRVCECVSAQLRGEDLFVRSGGEEFLILLPQIDEGILLKVAERIRAAVAAMAPDPAPVTVSLGTTLIRPEKILARAGPGGRVALSGQAGRAQPGGPRWGALRGAVNRKEGDPGSPSFIWPGQISRTGSRYSAPPSAGRWPGR